MTELFDICDEQDRVIGRAPRAEVHAKNLLHRAVHLWIWNSRGELLLQLRTASKDQYPNCWTSSASGHVDAGEDYLTAAHRELREELRLAGSLTETARLPAGPETAYEHTVLYTLQTDQAPVPDPGEIAELAWFAPDTVDQMLAAEPERFTPPFRELFHLFRKTRRPTP